MKTIALTAAILALVLLPAAAQGDPAIPADTEIVTTASGLQYSVLKKGEGKVSPSRLSDTVTVHYTGWLKDGTVFDSSRRRGEPASFKVGGVIAGWTEGLRLMKVGDRFKMTIPWKLAYGEAGRGSIPAKADLIFDVELLEVEAGRPVPELPKLDAEKANKTESGILWSTLSGGRGPSLGADDIAILRYAFWNPESGELVECTETSPSDSKITGNTKSMPFPFLKEFLGFAKQGAVYALEVPPALAFGGRALGEKLPANSKTRWRLEVERVIAPTFDDSLEIRKTESGLEYQVLEEGEGTAPTALSRVKVHYAGWLTDGTLFDASHTRGQPASFGLNQVISGWTEGLQLMKPGAVYLFRIPWNLAYGEAGRRPTIPPKADLIFHVELLEIL